MAAAKTERRRDRRDARAAASTKGTHERAAARAAADIRRKDFEQHEETIRQEQDALLRARFYQQRRQSPVARLGAAAPAARLGSAHFGASWGNEAADQGSKPAASAAAAASAPAGEARRRLHEEVRFFFSLLTRVRSFLFLLTRAREHV